MGDYGYADNAPAAFHMIHSGQYDPTWLTIAKLLHAGDVLRLVWTADNNTGTITDAGLHADMLRMVVYRADKSVHTFNVAYSIIPGNSARMVQRYGSR